MSSKSEGYVNGRTGFHEDGVISSPPMAKKPMVRAWLLYNWKGSRDKDTYTVASFCPTLRGRKAIKLAKLNPIERLGICPLSRDSSGRRKKIDWTKGVEIDRIHQLYRIIRHKKEHIAIIRCDFHYADKAVPTMSLARTPDLELPLEAVVDAGLLLLAGGGK